MSLFTSSHFVSACAKGSDWRVTVKNILQQLEAIRSDMNDFNLGFIYISDHLSEDAPSILNMLKSVLGVENWVGSTAMGVCGSGVSYIDEPSISVMLAHFEEESFEIFNMTDEQGSRLPKPVDAWLKDRFPMLSFVHADAFSHADIGQQMLDVADATNSFMVGGVGSSRNIQYQFAGGVFEGGLSGVIMDESVKVATTLSQGCHIIASSHNVSNSDDNSIFELDGERALDVFMRDLRSMTIKITDQDPDEIMVDPDNIPEEFQAVLNGEVHAAVTVSESDQKDYMVRHIIGIDPDEGAISIADSVGIGERILFVRRDEKTMREDLVESLLSLKARIEKDEGRFEPKGGLYVSCIARANFEADKHPHAEMSVIREIIGDIPLAGFYAGGEVSNARLYGYTGVLTLFL